MQAQLSIEKNTIISTDTDFTSLEDFNYIYADITGDGQLIFNASNKQELTTSYLTQLPNVSIQNSKSFSFNTAIQIEGDLHINADLITIYSSIYLEGKLQVADHTKIFGVENIQLKTKYQPQPFPLSNQHQTTEITFGIDYLENTNTATNLNIKKKKYYYKNIASYLLAIEIPTPPPENRC